MEPQCLLQWAYLIILTMLCYLSYLRKHHYLQYFLIYVPTTTLSRESGKAVSTKEIMYLSREVLYKFWRHKNFDHISLLRQGM
jgi:hypothetical protein